MNIRSPERRNYVEIFIHPYDLFISIRKVRRRAYVFTISRQSLGFEPLYQSGPTWITVTAAANAVCGMLRSTLSTYMEELRDPESVLGKLQNPDGGEIDPMKYLNPELIAWVKKEIMKDQVLPAASTKDFPRDSKG